MVGKQEERPGKGLVLCDRAVYIIRRGVEYEYRVNLESRQYLKAKDDETRVGNDEGVDAPCKDYHQSPRPPLLLQHILGLVDLARKVW